MFINCLNGTYEPLNHHTLLNVFKIDEKNNLVPNGFRYFIFYAYTFIGKNCSDLNIGHSPLVHFAMINENYSCLTSLVMSNMELDDLHP